MQDNPEGGELDPANDVCRRCKKNSPSNIWYRLSFNSPLKVFFFKYSSTSETRYVTSYVPQSSISDTNQCPRRHFYTALFTGKCPRVWPRQTNNKLYVLRGAHFFINEFSGGTLSIGVARNRAVITFPPFSWNETYWHIRRRLG